MKQEKNCIGNRGGATIATRGKTCNKQGVGAYHNMAKTRGDIHAQQRSWPPTCTPFFMPPYWYKCYIRGVLGSFLGGILELGLRVLGYFPKPY